MHRPSAVDESNLYKIRNKIAGGMNTTRERAGGRPAVAPQAGVGQALAGVGLPGGGGRELELRELLSYCVYIELCYVG